jgi:rod shape determining protein RodA
VRFTDYKLAFVVAAISAIGLVALSSAAYGNFLLKQSIYFAISLLIVAFIYRFFALEFFNKTAVILYWLNIILLIVLKFFGTTQLGSQRWISLGPINIQPSEIAKICLIIFLAAVLSKSKISTYYDIFKIFIYIAPPSLLVLIQPDLGTTLVYIAITFGMLFWAGASLVQLLVIMSPIITAICSALGPSLVHYQNEYFEINFTLAALVFLAFLALVILFYYQIWRSPWNMSLALAVVLFNGAVVFLRPLAWGLLKAYQQKRLTIFVDPYADPLGAGYHIIQSLYAIGSGGLAGAGWKQGDLSQGNFVPEQHTDFIFSLVGEEFGFIGTALTIILFATLCVLIIMRAYQAKDRFDSLLLVGIFSMLIFHIFENIGMNLSLMPITGVPLPFMSYGGTSLIVNMFLVSLVAKVHQEHLIN